MTSISLYGNQCGRALSCYYLGLPPNGWLYATDPIVIFECSFRWIPDFAPCDDSSPIIFRIFSLEYTAAFSTLHHRHSMPIKQPLFPSSKTFFHPKNILCYLSLKQKSSHWLWSLAVTSHANERQMFPFTLLCLLTTFSLSTAYNSSIKFGFVIRSLSFSPRSFLTSTTPFFHLPSILSHNRSVHLHETVILFFKFPLNVQRSECPWNP